MSEAYGYLLASTGGLEAILEVTGNVLVRQIQNGKHVASLRVERADLAELRDALATAVDALAAGKLERGDVTVLRRAMELQAARKGGAKR